MEDNGILVIKFWAPICIDGIVTRFVVSTDGEIMHYKNKKILKIRYDSKHDYGDVRVFIKELGRKVTLRVHCEVAKAFLKKPDDDKEYEIDHIDGNKRNNNVENLEWVTHEENVRRAVANNLQRPHIGEDNVTSKLTEKEVREICELLVENKLTTVDIAKRFNISQAVIAAIKSGRTWRHVSKDYNMPPVKCHLVLLDYHEVINDAIMAGMKPAEIREKIPLNISKKAYIDFIQNQKRKLKKLGKI
jgi:hypothetical protein